MCIRDSLGIFHEELVQHILVEVSCLRILERSLSQQRMNACFQAVSYTHLANRTGKRTFLMSEQFGINRTLRNSTTVDSNILPVLPPCLLYTSLTIS